MIRATILALMLLCVTMSAHSGRTDQYGGHHNWQNGGTYHYHRHKPKEIVTTGELIERNWVGIIFYGALGVWGWIALLNWSEKRSILERERERKENECREAQRQAEREQRMSPEEKRQAQWRADFDRRFQEKYYPKGKK